MPMMSAGNSRAQRGAGAATRPLAALAAVVALTLWERVLVGPSVFHADVSQCSFSQVVLLALFALTFARPRGTVPPREQAGPGWMVPLVWFLNGVSMQLACLFLLWFPGLHLALPNGSVLHCSPFWFALVFATLTAAGVVRSLRHGQGPP